MTTTTPTPEPDDVNRGLAELERYVAAQIPTTAPAPAPAADVEPEELLPAAPSKRVRALRAEVEEARQLIELQDDAAPLLIDTPKVRRRSKQAREAARLHALAQDPTMRAWQAARMRKLLVIGAMISLTLALTWSTAGVQKFAAADADAWSLGWLFAWFVEPFLSIALLVVVGAKAYMAAQGQPLRSRVLVRIEVLFLGLTLGMNAFPYLPAVATKFDFPQLVLHLLGPIVAVAVVTALPLILAGFNELDHSRGADDSGAVLGAVLAGVHPRSTGGTRTAGGTRQDYIQALTARAERLIEAGELPPDAGVHRIRKALGCGTPYATAVHQVLREERA
ncbi:conjugal transfer protein TraI [Herbidospora sp. NEAU-GS84]|uniref:Conjugal transfer protein TraI n=1 Tax=Herbidospora solisilvae TaxID=2696284 RepID=A0A7C9JHD4_9ACTN|nr:conjugal transfer protein TraI [Herbidospora solisilvae]NAS27464.1 conjugal transfer protein TraI [Herbidospora solisilvae]